MCEFHRFHDSILIHLIAIPKSERKHAEFHGMKHANASMYLVKRQIIDQGDPFPMLAINGSAAFSGRSGLQVHRLVFPSVQDSARDHSKGGGEFLGDVFGHALGLRACTRKG